MRNFFSFLFLLSFGLLSSCAIHKTNESQVQEDIINKFWYLSSLRGEKHLGKDKVVLTFDSKTNTYTCQSFCNILYGSYSLDQGTINMEQAVMSYKACPKASLEKKLQDVLSEIDRYKIINSALHCYAQDKLLVVFSSDNTKK